MGPPTISVIGYIDMDFTMATPRLPDPGESLQAKEYSASPGGKGANSAVAAFRSVHKKAHHGDTAGQVHFEYPYEGEDIQIRMIGAVGQDGNGPLAVQNLKENGVDASGVKVLAGEMTGICFCLVESYTGENRLLFTLGATATIEPDEFMTPESLGNGVIPDLIISQLECRIRTVEQMIKTAGEAGIDVLLNAAPAAQILPETYQYLTHLIVNETEAAMLSGREVEDVVEETWLEIAEEFLLWKVKNVVITLGAQGAFYATANGKNGHVPAEKVKVLDTTGAGDTFVGVYATDYLRQKARNEWDIEHAIIRANRASAQTIRQYGAQATIPWANEIDEFEAEAEQHLANSLESLGVKEPRVEETPVEDVELTTIETQQ